MRANAYDKISNTLHVVYNDVAEQSMHNAAEETRHSLKEGIADDEIINTGVTVDGAWSKHGYVSINGLVTAISTRNGKCLDRYVQVEKY